MHLAALTSIRREQCEEEKRGAIPGWHGQRVHLHPPHSPPELPREVEIPCEFRRAGKTHPGRGGSSISGWAVHTGRDGTVPTSWAPMTKGSPFDRWVWCNLTNYSSLDANLHFSPFSNL